VQSSRRLALLALLLVVAEPLAVRAQTPNPLQEWQYPGGVVLEKLFIPDLPEWRVALGAAAVLMPLYQGARVYRLEPGPVIDIRYRDLAFASVGEGIGINVIHGMKYHASISVGYDLGRRVSEDPSRLQGLGDIDPAPVLKLSESYVLSKRFPLILRADVRRIVGGADGWLGDLEAYMPLPGSSQTFVMFAGPSITFADRRYVQKVFGVTAVQSAASGYREYAGHGGMNSTGVGFSATRFITSTFMINVDAAISRLDGSAHDSPLAQASVQRVVELSLVYRH
jgi:outer membrane scaffolding protein for murein synthesis (MipA/OmpV family)